MTPRRTARLVAYAVLAIICVALVAASSILFVWPRSDRPGPVGAVLVLNGSSEAEKTRLALSFMRRGTAPVMLYSVGSKYSRCPRTPGIRTVCFIPRPERTVGEINYANAYARAHGIRSILVVSGHAQTTRARLLAHRCFTGTSLVVAAPAPWWTVPWQVVYEWAGMAKATLIQTGCS